MLCGSALFFGKLYSLEAILTIEFAQKTASSYNILSPLGTPSKDHSPSMKIGPGNPKSGGHHSPLFPCEDWPKDTQHASIAEWGFENGFPSF